jgi:signal transduction histidine kinase
MVLRWIPVNRARRTCEIRRAPSKVESWQEIITCPFGKNLCRQREREEADENVPRALMADVAGLQALIERSVRTATPAVADDGAGFDPKTTPRGTGTANIADRLEGLGGTLEVGSQPDEGTIIAGRIPARRTLLHIGRQ